jgi:GntR family transcriptional repressor for pyruvate dehydrogenase complex
MDRRRKSLAAQVTQGLRQKISAGEYSPGGRIPPEYELCAIFGVSRTVVREAVAALRADGLLASRQGSGVFVTELSADRPFQLDLAFAGTVREIINILALRTSVEVEAAGLAAHHRTRAQLDEIAHHLAEMQRLADSPDERGLADFRFHVAIAKATENPYFVRFLGFLGPYILPLFSRVSTGTAEVTPEYLRKLARQHNCIMMEITRRNEGRARAAMRRHLVQSISRYRSVVGERDSSGSS